MKIIAKDIKFVPRVSLCTCGCKFEYEPSDTFFNMYRQEGVTCPSCKKTFICRDEPWVPINEKH
jgi:hypothetical protein